MTASFTLNITCSPATVRALQSEGNALVALAAVQGSDAAALPLVWMATTSYSSATVLSSSADYGVYASSTPLAAGRVVQMDTGAPIVPGQTFRVQTGPRGIVVNGGAAGTIMIKNDGETPYRCGIRQTVNGVLAPVCIFPLHGNNLQVIRPLAQLALLFTTAPMGVGEIWRGLAGDAGPILSIDMSANTTASVTYDVNAGWSWPETLLGAKTIASAEVVHTLIQPPPLPHPQPKQSR